MYKILVVEDDKTIREVINSVLVERNYLVETAEDGSAGLDSLRKQQPDLIILDLGLPKISGESVLTEVKRQYPQIPVIVLTAKNHTTDIVKGFQLGADDYMSKPFELEELIARVG